MVKVIFILLIEIQSYAENSASVVQQTTINAVLFSEGNESWTQRDLNLYKKLVQHLFHKEKLSEFSDSIRDDFLISRVVKREAILFEIEANKIKLNKLNKLNSTSYADLSEYSKNEIHSEVDAISFASALLELKEKQMNQKARFKAWVDVLKRKYNVKIKSNEFSK